MRLTQDKWLATLCIARVLMYSNFMVYAACIPVLMLEWNMNATEAGTIASGFMGAYAVSLFVFSWLSDHYGARNVFIWSAYSSALTALAFGFLARSYSSGLVFYALAAITQGGMYTPAIMLLSDRYHNNKLGTAMGYLIASTSIGYAFSLLMSGVFLSLGGYRTAFIVSGLLPLLGVWLTNRALGDTKNVIHPRPHDAGFLKVWKQNTNARYLTTGYTFHCWELLGMWSWTPAFFAAAISLSGNGLASTAEFGAYLTAVMHIIGSFASTSMGKLSDRLGRRSVLIGVAAAGAVLSFSIGWLLFLPIWLLTLLGLAYYYAAIGDSPVLSTAISEAVQPGYLGSVLAVRAFLGFAVGAIAPIAFGWVIDLTNTPGEPVTHWGWAFMTLGVGGLLAAVFAVLYKPGKCS